MQKMKKVRPRLPQFQVNQSTSSFSGITMNWLATTANTKIIVTQKRKNTMISLQSEAKDSNFFLSSASKKNGKAALKIKKDLESTCCLDTQAIWSNVNMKTMKNLPQNLSEGRTGTLPARNLCRNCTARSTQSRSRMNTSAMSWRGSGAETDSQTKYMKMQDAASRSFLQECEVWKQQATWSQSYWCRESKLISFSIMGSRQCRASWTCLMAESIFSLSLSPFCRSWPHQIRFLLCNGSMIADYPRSPSEKKRFRIGPFVQLQYYQINIIVTSSCNPERCSTMLVFLSLQVDRPFIGLPSTQTKNNNKTDQIAQKLRYLSNQILIAIRFKQFFYRYPRQLLSLSSGAWDQRFQHFLLFAPCDNQVLHLAGVLHVPVLLVVAHDLLPDLGAGGWVGNAVGQLHQLPVQAQGLG